MPDTFSAQAAMAVLDDGGNAVDAAITAQFVLAVTLPEAGNIGGGGFMTIVKDGEQRFLDYREEAPGAAHRDMYLDDEGKVKTREPLFGAKASGVPGTVAGMWKAHQAYGTLPWARLLAPAIALAEDGFVVPAHLADRVAKYIKRTSQRGIETNFADHFGDIESNQRFVQPELAATLRHIQQHGHDGFYAGKVASQIEDFMEDNGGLITTDDLAAYQAKWRQPLSLSWRDFTLVTAPPPSSGGVAVAQWLNMLEAYATTHTMPAHNSPDYLHVMSEIGKRVFADRAEYLGDPDFVDVPVAALTDPAYFARRASDINPTAISPSKPVEPGLIESEDTTHFSIVDKHGNAVSNTTTLNLSFGSGMVVAGAGFLLNDEMDDFSAKPGVPNFFGAIGGEANAIAPGKRMLSSMTPTIVLRDNEVALVTGSPGGTTIISSVTQTILNALAFEQNATMSANAPRFHHQLWPKDTIRVHPGFDTGTLKHLEQMGYTLDRRRFGDVQLIKQDSTGLSAASEQSGRGEAMVRDAHTD
ncbi:gamma-glutamyltranspeptidase [Alteromonas halophila]|uniref:Glutathione hydrolase proenzyme n=2 Tax=Alteromonas halophila TaxID=516698 RepID=A0A918JGS8_9ALTE|nr:gamma-glutamyltranspeptidase [Alteromonas halophila]